MRTRILLGLLLATTACFLPNSTCAQMDSYFTSINYPVPKGGLMLEFLSDYQLARSSPDFLTFMGMGEYGITPRWTAGFMAEGQKIPGMPVTLGGVRLNTYVRLFPKDQFVNFTLYGEFEDLNQAALYKMEVTGFGGEDLTSSLAVARNTPARTFEQRAIVYHDWGRTNLTFNFVNETGIESHENDFGYAWGIFRQPEWDSMAMEGGSEMEMSHRRTAGKVPPLISTERFGYGLEMIGALGNTDRFGFYWHREQQYAGPVFCYRLGRNWTFRAEPAFGLSDVSDRIVLRMGIGYSIERIAPYGRAR